MFSILDGTLKVCHMQQCLVVNCSTTKHQQWSPTVANIPVHPTMLDVAYMYETSLIPVADYHRLLPSSVWPHQWSVVSASAAAAATTTDVTRRC